MIAVIDNYMTEESFQPWDIPVISFDKYLSARVKAPIVVATSERAWIQIKAQLIENGLKEFKDFFYYTIWKKKLAMVYGNCHVISIKQALSYNEDFNKIYGIYPLPLIQILTPSEVSDMSEGGLFSNCDLFIHQSIRKENRYGQDFSSEKMISKLNSHCKVVAIPNLYGLPKYMFPQIDEKLKYKAIRGQWYFGFRDKYIEKLAYEGKTATYIEQAIRFESFVSEDEIEERYNLYLDKLSIREEQWDVKIKNFLEEKHRSYILFYDVNHPTNTVLKYIVQEVLKTMDCRIFPGEYDMVELLDTYEIPTYGQIRNHFSMDFDDDSLMRKYSKYTLSSRPISLLDYVNEYLLWDKA